MTRQYNNQGRDQINIENLNLNIVSQLISEFPSIESQEVPPLRKVFNYIGGLFFLIIVLCWWFLLNFFTKCTFPFKRIFALILASLALMPNPTKEDRNGLNMLWHEIEQQCREKLSLTQQDLEIDNINRREYNRFNEEASETWVLKNLIKILTSGSRSKSQEVDRVLEILQKQEDAISSNLRQLRKKLDPTLDDLREILNKLNEPSAETDYQRINKILNALVYKFTLRSTPSREQAENLIEELRQVIVENTHNIDVSRIGTLHSVLQLLKWLAATGYSQSFEYEFEAEVDLARREKAIELIINQATEALRKIIKDISDETLESVELGIRNKWLDEISIYGFTGRGLAVVELSLDIDWNKFNMWRDRSVHDGMVRIKWNRKVAIEIDATMDRLNNRMQAHNLSPSWRVSIAPGFTEQEEETILRTLKMQHSPVYWDEQGIKDEEEKTRVKDLTELGVGLYFKPRKHKKYR